MTATKTILVMMFAVLHHTFGNAQCTATSSGDWSDPTNWSCGYVPGCGDLMIIPAGIVITLDSHLNIEESDGCFTPSYIQVFGTLRMQTGKKIYMSCGSSIEIMDGGLLQRGIGGGHSNWIEICDSIQWIAEDGNVPGYHLFGSMIPLPTTIVSFDVNDTNNNELTFSWTIESERNVNRYEVEFSADAINWNTIAVVNSRGDGTETFTYSATIPDNSIQSGYFRLRSIDNDETISTYGKILFYERQTEGLVVFPNPAGSDQVINFRFSENETSAIYVYDQTGNIVYSNENTDRMETITIDGNTLAKGMYLVKSERSTPTLFVVE